MIIEDIRIAKNSVNGLSLYELHFGRKPNSEWSLATDNLKSEILLDKQILERDPLTADERRELCDSRPRVKVVKKGQQSRDVSLKIRMETTQIANTPYYKSLEQLAKSANEWMIWKKKLSHEEGCRALRTLTERDQLLAASLRNNLTTGTLRFRQDAIKSPTTSTKCKLESLLLSSPNSVEVFRKVANRKSGKQLFKRYGNKIIKATPSTYIMAAGKVIRKSDISLRLRNPQVSGRQGPSKPLLGKRLKRQRKISSSSSSDERLVPKAQTQQKQLAAATRLAVPTGRQQGKVRKSLPV